VLTNGLRRIIVSIMTTNHHTRRLDFSRFLMDLDAPEIEPTNDELDEIEGEG
jgi:hypothetical protein